MSPARDGQGAVADVCGSVTVGVLAEVRCSEKAFSVVSPAPGSRHLLPGFGVLSDIPAHLLSMLEGPVSWAVTRMGPFGGVGRLGLLGKVS